MSLNWVWVIFLHKWVLLAFEAQPRSHVLWGEVWWSLVALYTREQNPSQRLGIQGTSLGSESQGIRSRGWTPNVGPSTTGHVAACAVASLPTGADTAAWLAYGCSTFGNGLYFLPHPVGLGVECALANETGAKATQPATCSQLTLRIYCRGLGVSLFCFF